MLLLLVEYESIKEAGWRYFKQRNRGENEMFTFEGMKWQIQK